MADKQPVSLIIKANLECDKCYKKIQKVLLKLKEKEKILRVDYDNKGNKIVICGYFKQEELAQKLRCKLCEAIKDIEIVPVKKLEEKKKVEEKKPDEKKTTEEKKKTDDKKPEEGKKDEKPKPKDKEEAPKAAAVAPSTTVNLQFTQMCGTCYPWPCTDPSHLGGGFVHPQWPCEAPAPPAFPGHQHPPWGGVVAPVIPKWPCGGPSYCGGCGTCGGGWPAMTMPAPPQPMCCPGPSSCRGCKGCRIVQEGKFVYEEYPHPPSSACAVM
ncbi:protein PYRICULARIA ORYZAE RESISTANCE 21-like [Oryza brachyantha]|uniref:protein PYRICULARIA ORYZAE RESISTANCE 21-like n=1 Tax=Oryza brachyantha TaxID=4533 RepID=UPI001ADC97B5|nr:protein PYRICULARIA ORYZAE RESISTANCE 21-like [Oryza brachyantha]XP_040381973.1 protein PYRICULARIA ORYZAE RESISTANCE 21-like [Oryza brachyantha]XP_040381974.1 protein PYRICULARIA ORYZAE RESISTANCE 21-like [Oryza brachyantha]XP_040381975.1 protein PYRICULARIA ORYZAE RESISTANCE 21-like [Oryza brachyantha]XP_040381976.1 protein PYRICULARIA ORYZAE RESISTANCE 21-like [Oryza brachyantha]